MASKNVFLLDFSGGRLADQFNKIKQEITGFIYS